MIEESDSEDDFFLIQEKPLRTIEDNDEENIDMRNMYDFNDVINKNPGNSEQNRMY